MEAILAGTRVRPNFRTVDSIGLSKRAKGKHHRRRRRSLKDISVCGR